MGNIKAISSLITVVLLLGFVVVLSVLLFEFGGGFINDLISQQKAEINFECGKLDVEIVSACFEGDVTLKNNGGEIVSASSLIVCKGEDDSYSKPISVLDDLEGFSQMDVFLDCNLLEVEFYPYIEFEGSIERCDNFVSSEVVEC